jgi:hypothetical protein
VFCCLGNIAAANAKVSTSQAVKRLHAVSSSNSSSSDSESELQKSCCK